MVLSLAFLLMIFVIVFLGCAAFGVPAPHPRVSWGWLGMFGWAIKVVFAGVS